MPEKQKSYLTSRQAAERLGVAVSTIQQWTNNGLLQAWVTEGGHRRITFSSVEEMLKRKNVVTDGVGHRQQMSVVVVDDDPQQLRMYEKFFNAWEINAELITATDGYEGMIKIGSSLPDVIITDLMMPKVDGFEMIKAMKKIPELNDCLMIAVTGLREEEIKEKGGVPDGVHLFVKPIPFEKLKDLLRQKTTLRAA